MYKTSTDYGRLLEMIQKTGGDQRSSGILCRARYGSGEDVSPWYTCPCASNFVVGKDAFLAYCEKAKIEFIDPASQQKTPAELAAGEMVELLSKCDSCINYLLHGVVDSPVIGEAENTMIEIKELLKKARGEA